MSNQDLLLQALADLPPVELKKLHWYLTQEVLKGFTPIPPRWLRSADAWTTAETMVRCYQKEGAVRIMGEILSKIGQTGHVDELRSRCPQTVVPPRIQMDPKPSPDFVKTQRRKFIHEIQHPGAILNALQKCGLLGEAEKEAVNIYASRMDKNRALVDLVLRKGAEAQEMFYQVLSQSELFLLEDLDLHHTTSKQPAAGSVLPGWLDTLTSDELRSFQWLVTQQPGEDFPPIFRNQLSHADRMQTQNILERHFGPEQAAVATLDILLKILPMPSLGLEVATLPPSGVMEEQSESRGQPNATPDATPDAMPTEITPEVHEEENMYRLRCLQAGVFRCSQTGLVLEGDGDIIYQTVPWDRQFLAAKGWRPAGPLFKFTCLRGTFHRLHLPHCEIFSDGRRDFLSVAHVTEDQVNFIQPQRTTDKHVVINISGFSGFGLVRESDRSACNSPISGLVLLFYQPTADPELFASLYVLLLPRNVSIPEVAREWKKRSRAEYIEALPDCELIPNQMYKLSGSPAQLIQPEIAKFLNFENYNNYTASFEVQLAMDTKKVELVLKDSRVCCYWVPGWLADLQESVIWRRVIKLKIMPSPDIIDGNSEMKDFLVKTLNSLRTEELETFQRHLSQCPDPIPVCVLEAADRMTTVDKMVQKYLTGGAKDVTVEILRKMHYNKLADDLAGM